MDKREIAKQLNEEAQVFILEKSFTDLFNITSDQTPLSEMVRPPKNMILNTFKGLVFACIDVRAEAVSLVKWKLKKNDKYLEDKNDYIYKLLKRPNPLFTWKSFSYLYQVYEDIFGEVYIYIVRKKGVPVELWILPSQYVKPVFKQKAKSDNIISHFEMNFTGTNGQSYKFKYSTKEIVYHKKPSPFDPKRGIGRLERALLEIDIHNFSKTYVRNFYKNGAVPQGILTTDKTLLENDIERLRTLWYEKYGGTAKSWKIAILFGGLKYESLSVNPATSDFIEQSKWSRDDILSIFKVPPIMLGVEDRGASKTSAQVQERLFAKNVVKPAIVSLEELINYDLFPKIGADGYEIEFDNPVPEDEELKVSKVKVGGLYGIITVNEARELLGFEKLEDEELGNQLLEPLNLPEGRKPKEDRSPEEEDSKDYVLDEIIKQLDLGVESIEY